MDLVLTRLDREDWRFQKMKIDSDLRLMSRLMLKGGRMKVLSRENFEDL